MKTIKEVGQFIKEQRKAQGLTQTQLAEKVGLPKPRISELENGKFDCGFEYVSKIVNALGHEFTTKNTVV